MGRGVVRKVAFRDENGDEVFFPQTASIDLPGCIHILFSISFQAPLGSLQLVHMSGVSAGDRASDLSLPGTALMMHPLALTIIHLRLLFLSVHCLRIRPITVF